MYIPRRFRITETEAGQELMRAHPFAMLVSSGADRPAITHLPMHLSPGGEYGVLQAHMARGNPHWQTFTDGAPAVCVFHGPHAYVSPRWYADDEAVPTWDYATVHAHGVPYVIEAADELHAMLATQAGEFENHRAEPWTLEESPQAIARRLPGIVGLRMEITRLEIKFKISQDRTEIERERVMEALAASWNADDQALAAFMRAFYTGTS
jgi:transcriptional regulator